MVNETIGTLGWHSFLQSKMIPFCSGGYNSAVQWIHRIHGDIRPKAIAESLRLGALRGECDDCQGTGMRNSHLFAIAPNASSSSLVNTSPSIEPWNSNAFNAQGRAGSFLIKNKYLENLLEEKGMNNDDVWSDIIGNSGSVQHLTCLSDFEKSVFETFEETDPKWIIELASIRQPYICQSQSLNICVRPDITLQEMSDIHIDAWYKGVKSLYYCRSKAASKVSLGTGGAKPLNAVPVVKKIEYSMENSCLSCEG